MPNHLTNVRCWTLFFDGKTFCLEPRVEAAQVEVRHRVIEESLEMILFHWGHDLLPGPRLHMMQQSAAIVNQQDLLAIDDLGRARQL